MTESCYCAIRHPTLSATASCFGAIRPLHSFIRTVPNSVFCDGVTVIGKFFTAQRYDGTVRAMALCVYVCPSQVGVLSKWINVGSRKQRRTIT